MDRTGKPSPKKGKPFTGDREKASRDRLKYLETHDVWNRKDIEVTQIGLDGVVIQEWKSHHEAAESLKVYNRLILRACKVQGICRGFKWKFKNETI